MCQLEPWQGQRCSSSRSCARLLATYDKSTWADLFSLALYVLRMYILLMNNATQIEAMVLNYSTEIGAPVRVWVAAKIVATRKTARGLRLTVEAQGSQFFIFAGSPSIREIA